MFQGEIGNQPCWPSFESKTTLNSPTVFAQLRDGKEMRLRSRGANSFSVLCRGRGGTSWNCGWTKTTSGTGWQAVFAPYRGISIPTGTGLCDVLLERFHRKTMCRGNKFPKEVRILPCWWQAANSCAGSPPSKVVAICVNPLVLEDCFPFSKGVLRTSISCWRIIQVCTALAS